MSNATTIPRPRLEPLAVEAVGIAKEVIALVRSGLPADEVAKRLADPANVGRKLIEAAVARREAGTAYLGRDPAPVLARVEDAPLPNMSERGRKKSK